MNIRLDGKVALVTGGSTGIGQAIARALSASGASVGVNYVANRALAYATVKGICDEDGRAIAIEADISDPVAVSGMFAQLEQAFGAPDILINCAGIDGKAASSWEADPAAWRKVIEVNLFGTFYCSQQALQRMVERKSGVILNITSVHEVIAWSGYSAYTSSKAAVSMLTKTMAQEAAPFGVRVLAVAPGAIQTDINKSVWTDPVQNADLLEKIPMGRLGQVQEIASLVTFLVSDAASYITATSVLADGGMTDYPDFAHGG